MATKCKRKLVDVSEGALRVYAALEGFLERHSIPYTFHIHTEGFRRYYVDSVNLCCAQAVLPALKDLEERAPRCAACGMNGDEVYADAANVIPDEIDPICCETVIGDQPRNSVPIWNDLLR